MWSFKSTVWTISDLVLSNDATCSNLAQALWCRSQIVVVDFQHYAHMSTSLKPSKRNDQRHLSFPCNFRIHAVFCSLIWFADSWCLMFLWCLFPSSSYCPARILVNLLHFGLTRLWVLRRVVRPNSVCKTEVVLCCLLCWVTFQHFQGELDFQVILGFTIHNIVVTVHFSAYDSQIVF